MHGSTKTVFGLGAMLGLVFTFMANTAFAGPLPSNIRSEKSVLGTIYAAANGKSVYEFKKDTPHSGKSMCYSKCATAWPPVTPPAGFSPSGDWGKITRTDGSTQLTYTGSPLYTWIGDKKPGQITGQGFHNAWRVVTTNGSEPGWSKKP